MIDNKALITGLEKTIDEAIAMLNGQTWGGPHSEWFSAAVAVRSKLREARPIDRVTEVVSTDVCAMLGKASLS